MEMPERFARLVIMNTGLPVSGKPLGPAFMAWKAFANRVRRSERRAVAAKRSAISELSPEVVAAYDAPYPDASYKGGALQFPNLVPIADDAEALPHMRRDGRGPENRGPSRRWSCSPTRTRSRPAAKAIFRALIPTAKDEPEITIPDAGHFLQEDKGEEIAEQSSSSSSGARSLITGGRADLVHKPSTKTYREAREDKP